MDPSGIMISVSVITDEGVEYPLRMGGNSDARADGGDPSLPPDLPIVQSVEVGMTLNAVSSITVELAANYELGLALLQSAIFIIGNTITVEFGYSRIGLFFPRFSSMAVQPKISLNPESGLTATLTGQAGMFAATRSMSPRTHATGKSYKQIIEDIGNYNHNKWLVKFPVRKGDNDPLYVERPGVSQTRSDWEAVKTMCRASGCSIVIRPVANEGGRARMVITRGTDSSSTQPVITLVARSQIDMLNKFPLLSLESEAEGVWFSAGSDRTRTADIRNEDRSTPEEVSNQDTVADDGETPLQSGSAGDGAEDGDEVNAAVRTAEADGDDRYVYAPDSATGVRPREQNNTVNREEQGRGGGIQLNVSTVGNPLAFPNELLRIEGAGLFDGNYTINGLNHRVAGGDWTTDYRLIRSQPFEEGFFHRAFRRSWDPNDQEPEELFDSQGGGNIELDPYSVEDI